MSGNPHPAQAPYADHSATEIVAFIKQHERITLADADEVRNTDLSGQFGGIYVRSTRSRYQIDTENIDADDGLDVLIDGAGNHFVVVPALLPSWLPLVSDWAPDIYADFAGQHYWYNGPFSDYASWFAAIGGSFTRASAGYFVNRLGLLESAASGAVRFEYDATTLAPKGIMGEVSRTNVVLFNRDLTNAAWTKSNVTAALNQTGADGVANAASSLTATAGNGTCLQAITLGSSARYQSAYVKRLTGSGVIQMTTDNGSTWTTIAVTSAWKPLEIPTQTLANPTVGFRIVTNGDAIAVDFVQNENGANRSSPIATTTVAGTRAADLWSVPIADAGNLTAYFKGDLTFQPIIGCMFCLLASGATKTEVFPNAGSLQFYDKGADALVGSLLSILANTQFKVAFSNSLTTTSAVANAGAIQSAGSFTRGLHDSLRLMASGAGQQPFGHISEFAYWSSVAAPNSELTRLTT